MSGIEVAGLVLGAIPVAIEALKWFGNGLSGLQRARRYENELERIINKLENERVRLQDVCEKLLIGLVPQSRIERLIQDPMGLLQDQPALDGKLRQRLWRSYGHFEATLKDVNDAMEEAQRRIDAQRQGPKLDIRKALRHSFLNDSLSKISEGLSTLEDLINRGIEMEPARKGRFQGRFLHIIRAAAGGLYRAVRSSLDCPCEHHACLQLQNRTASITPGDTDDDKIISDLEFRLALSYGNAEPTSDASLDDNRTWADVLVRGAPRDDRHVPPSSTVSQPADPKGKKRVRFSTILGLSSPTASCAPLTSSSINLRQVSVELEKINRQSLASSNALKLCEIMRRPQTQTQDRCYGLIVDCGTQPASTYTVHPILKKRRATHDKSVISLHDVLSKNGRYMLLSEQSRFQLAVVISSSVLQLHGSPWMPEEISSHDLYFIQCRDDPICDRLFVLKRFPPCTENGRKEQRVIDRRNATLFYLGILLIELTLGKSFESLRTERERSLNISRFEADYVTAARLLNEVYRVVGPICGSAIARCIDGEFHERESSLEDTDLSHDVYSGVVALLEKELENSIV